MPQIILRKQENSLISDYSDSPRMSFLHFYYQKQKKLAIVMLFFWVFICMVSGDYQSRTLGINANTWLVKLSYFCFTLKERVRDYQSRLLAYLFPSAFTDVIKGPGLAQPASFLSFICLNSREECTVWFCR